MLLARWAELFLSYFLMHQSSLAMHYVFRSIVALHSFRLKLCSVKYIVAMAQTHIQTHGHVVPMTELAQWG